MKTPQHGRAAHFLNVDLDLESRAGLANLLTALEPHVFVLSSTARRASVELAKQPRSAEEAVVGIIRLVQTLSVKGRRAWRQCTKRVLNIGLQAGESPHQFVVPLSAQVIQEVARASLGLAITVYPQYASRDSGSERNSSR